MPYVNTQLHSGRADKDIKRVVHRSKPLLDGLSILALHLPTMLLRHQGNRLVESLPILTPEVVPFETTGDKATTANARTDMEGLEVMH